MYTIISVPLIRILDDGELLLWKKGKNTPNGLRNPDISGYGYVGRYDSI